MPLPAEFVFPLALITPLTLEWQLFCVGTPICWVPYSSLEDDKPALARMMFLEELNCEELPQREALIALEKLILREVRDVFNRNLKSEAPSILQMEVLQSTMLKTFCINLLPTME